MDNSINSTTWRIGGESSGDIKKLFDTPGAAGIFIHFRAAINFKMDEKKDPSVQISKLQTTVDNLSAKQV